MAEDETKGQIGEKALLRQLFLQKVADGVVTTVTDLQIPIETIEASQQSFYVYSVIAVNQDVVLDVWQTAQFVGQNTLFGAGVVCSILKRRTLMTPDTIDIILYISSNIDGVELAYKVYRIAGLN